MCRGLQDLQGSERGLERYGPLRMPLASMPEIIASAILPAPMKEILGILGGGRLSTSAGAPGSVEKDLVHPQPCLGANRPAKTLKAREPPSPEILVLAYILCGNRRGRDSHFRMRATKSRNKRSRTSFEGLDSLNGQAQARTKSSRQMETYRCPARRR